MYDLEPHRSPRTLSSDGGLAWAFHFRKRVAKKSRVLALWGLNSLGFSSKGKRQNMGLFPIKALGCVVHPSGIFLFVAQTVQQYGGNDSAYLSQRAGESRALVIGDTLAVYSQLDTANRTAD